MKHHVMIMGARGYKRNYGGWETFVQNLINNWKDNDTQFYVYEIVNNIQEEDTIKYGNVICPQIYQKNIGNATMPVFCLKSLINAIKYVKENKLNNVIFYIIGLRLGPIFMILRPVLKDMGIKVIINPDGLEWKRAKWNWFVKQYFKISEATMLRYSDYIICDSEGIRSYIKEKYPSLNTPTKFVAYGTYPLENNTLTSKANELLDKFSIKPNEYYLIVGRFVPENNYELIIKEFMKSDTTKKLLIISNYEKNEFYDYLIESTMFNQDDRIIFGGTLYDKSGLQSIRSNAFAYIHGHSAGGTNPSLLEAMSSTEVNLLYDVVFNKEVGQDAALYFDEDRKSLCELINNCDKMSEYDRKIFGEKAKKRMQEYYTWDIVVEGHNKVFDTLIKKIEVCLE